MKIAGMEAGDSLHILLKAIETCCDPINFAACASSSPVLI